MAVWGVRAGQAGQQEREALEAGVITIDWPELPDLSGVASGEEMKALYRRLCRETRESVYTSKAGQVWEFIHGILVGDMVVLPLKNREEVAVGRVTGPYAYRDDHPSNVQHVRPVRWLAKDLARSGLGEDFRARLGARRTVWKIDIPDAEDRLVDLLEGRAAGLEPGGVGDRDRGRPPAYLLTWNPKQWPWPDLEAQARRTAENEPVADRWSCGNTRRIGPGDRLFLLRQGVEPRGIVAAGWATSGTFEAPHWDAERRGRGELALYVDVRFERILNADRDDPLPLSDLRSGPLAGVNWSTPASGILIREGVGELERLWRRHLGLYRVGEFDTDEPYALEGEVRIAFRRHRARERRLRDTKLGAHAAAHGGRLPCEVCGFDFALAFGEIGTGYAQVHHKVPLGVRQRPSETKMGDLAVLCANCHAMVHRGGGCRPLDALLKAARPASVGPNA